MDDIQRNPDGYHLWHADVLGQDGDQRTATVRRPSPKKEKKKTPAPLAGSAGPSAPSPRAGCTIAIPCRWRVSRDSRRREHHARSSSYLPPAAGRASGGGVRDRARFYPRRHQVSRPKAAGLEMEASARRRRRRPSIYDMAKMNRPGDVDRGRSCDRKDRRQERLQPAELPDVLTAPTPDYALAINPETVQAVGSAMIPFSVLGRRWAVCPGCRNVIRAHSRCLPSTNFGRSTAYAFRISDVTGHGPACLSAARRIRWPAFHFR